MRDKTNAGAEYPRCWITGFYSSSSLCDQLDSSGLPHPGERLTQSTIAGEDTTFVGAGERPNQDLAVPDCEDMAGYVHARGAVEYRKLSCVPQWAALKDEGVSVFILHLFGRKKEYRTQHISYTVQLLWQRAPLVFFYKLSNPERIFSPFLTLS